MVRLEDIYVYEWVSDQPLEFFETYPPHKYHEQYIQFMDDYRDWITQLLDDMFTFCKRPFVKVLKYLKTQGLNHLINDVFTFDFLQTHYEWVVPFIDVNKIDTNGKTLLSQAVELNEVLMVDYLLSNGAQKVNTQSTENIGFNIASIKKLYNHAFYSWFDIWNQYDLVHLYESVIQDDLEKVERFLKNNVANCNDIFKYNLCLITFATSTSMCQLLRKYNFYFFAITPQHQQLSLDIMAQYPRVIDYLTSIGELENMKHGSLLKYQTKKKRKLDSLVEEVFDRDCKRVIMSNF